MKFEEAVEKYLSESKMEAAISEIADIMMGRTGLDSDAPWKEYLKELKKTKMLKGTSDKEIKEIVDQLAEDYPEMFE
jgi:hypothetical protein